MSAKEFPADTRWINTVKPVTLAALRGRVVVMDFWTYCCINCLHALPRLAALERQYADQPVTVVGIHSGKFDQEHNDEKVFEAIAKYEIKHPVAMDNDFQIWNQWGVRAWPTLIFINSAGILAHVMTGEPEVGQLEAIVAQLLADGEKKGTLKIASSPNLVEAHQDDRILRFPGKILATENALFIADSGHHRVLIADRSGKVETVIGGPVAGFVDGDLESARFYEPQGMVLVDGILYVADRNNHALRRIDLISRQVTTIAGTGNKGRSRGLVGDPLKTDLRSPWDLSFRDGGLDIAMAGNHQLWRYTFAAKQIEVLAGSSLEAIVDGPLATSAFAQPSGLWREGNHIYVADSETSAIRKVDSEKGTVATLVGTGLFEFGFVDGIGRQAKLQHPLGICGDGQVLYIADSFNNAIRILDLHDNRVSTLHICGIDQLNEPSGISLLGSDLYVADTNSHRIVIIDKKSGEARALLVSL